MPGEDILGHYRLVRLLGRGGMGQVWLAEDTRLGREVALKVLPPELATDSEYRRRFEREARLAAKLRGPHVVPIHSFGELDGRLFIEMEFVEGSDLGKILDSQGALTPRRAVDLVAQVAAALDVAHAAGLVHRDVKPSNVLTLSSGFAYLIDFGIARGGGQTAITSTGMAVGTWAYMAPERFSGGEDLRSDVYSLACLLFECLTGERPFGQTNPAQQMAAHLTTPPPRLSDRHPQLPAALDAVIGRGMAKDPAQRFASAGELAGAAQAAMEGRPPPAATTPPTVKWGGGVDVPDRSGARSVSSPLSYPPSYPLTPPPSRTATPGYTPRPMPVSSGLFAPNGQPPQHYRSVPAHPVGAPGYNVAVALPQNARPISTGRIVWWVVLGLLLGCSAFLTLGAIVTTLSGDGFGSTGDNIGANLFFNAPSVIFGFVAYRQWRKFRR
ncbi:serine/threonine-protein kinase [Nocardia inohanensis]|uniref:serine/threonine-protein kinase n=1 Tax=Nocardia inohanensis TaxID=209246 RepID=UPI000A9531BD|nr:serine/threonine-protein kinase [Nocardia inohanensis]